MTRSPSKAVFVGALLVTSLLVVQNSFAQCDCSVTTRLQAPLDALAHPSETGRETIGFADHLFRQQMFFRAVGAYEEAAYYATEHVTKVNAAVGVALSYHLGRQYERAISSYGRALEMTRDTSLRLSLELDRTVGRCEFARSRSESQALLQGVSAMEELAARAEGKARVFAEFHLARFYLYLGSPLEAQEHASAAAERCLHREASDCLATSDLQKRLRIPMPTLKHPALGAVFSGIVPGAGAFYAEHYVDSIYYFVGVVGSGLLAWDVYERESSAWGQTPAFYVLAGFSGLLYMANVVQGYSMTNRLNAVRLQRHRARLQSGLLPPLLLDRVGHQPYDSLSQ